MLFQLMEMLYLQLIGDIHGCIQIHVHINKTEVTPLNTLQNIGWCFTKVTVILSASL